MQKSYTVLRSVQVTLISGRISVLGENAGPNPSPTLQKKYNIITDKTLGAAAVEAEHF